jgi:hypothetical protein
MKVLGKHSRGGRREEAYGLFGAVTSFKAMQAARPEASGNIRPGKTIRTLSRKQPGLPRHLDMFGCCH